MKKEFKNWRNFLMERKQAVQDQYEAYFHLALTQSKDIDRTELMGFMRAIENVTTVTRIKEISTSEREFVGEYRIRFVLPHGHSPKDYYAKLKSKLGLLDGLRIQQDFEYEKIGEE